MDEPVKNYMHIGISVQDLETSVKFYTELMGFTLERRVQNSGEKVSRVVGVPNATLDTAVVKKGNIYLELIDYQNGEAKRNATYKKQDEPGLIHIAFNFDNMESVYKKFKSMGYEFSSEPMVTREGGHKIAYFKGPDNVTIELVDND